jgi:hypothetical protein
LRAKALDLTAKRPSDKGKKTPTKVPKEDVDIGAKPEEITDDIRPGQPAATMKRFITRGARYGGARPQGTRKHMPY